MNSMAYFYDLFFVWSIYFAANGAYFIPTKKLNQILLAWLCFK